MGMLWAVSVSEVAGKGKCRVVWNGKMNGTERKNRNGKMPFSWNGKIDGT